MDGGAEGIDGKAQFQNGPGRRRRYFGLEAQLICLKFGSQRLPLLAVGDLADSTWVLRVEARPRGVKPETPAL